MLLYVHDNCIKPEIKRDITCAKNFSPRVSVTLHTQEIGKMSRLGCRDVTAILHILILNNKEIFFFGSLETSQLT